VDSIQSTRCDARPCISCPIGASCSAGSSPTWSHFVPKPLRLGQDPLPWVTVVQPDGTRSRLFCDGVTCAPHQDLDSYRALVSVDEYEEHLWEFSSNASTYGYLLRACPPGHQLINSTSDGAFSPSSQHCAPCGYGYYIVDRYRSCQKCPKAGNPDGCANGANFIPNDWSEVGMAAGSTWELVRQFDGSLVYRILECPSGYITRYDADIPEDDNCVKCGVGFYRLDRAGRNGTECLKCDESASCNGGNDVMARAGYWRMNFTYLESESDVIEVFSEAECREEGSVCMFPENSPRRSDWGKPMRCISIDKKLHCGRRKGRIERRSGARRSNGTADHLYGSKAQIFRCPRDRGQACGAANECLNNRTGPLCGYCLPGYSMTARGCSATKCLDEEQLAPIRTATIVFCAALAVSMWVALSWRPVFSTLDSLIAKMLSGLAACLFCGVLAQDTRGDTVDIKWGCIGLKKYCGSIVLACLPDISKIIKNVLKWLREIHAPEFFKIFLTYFQILGSFTMFDVEWPPELIQLIQFCKSVFKFEIAELPSISCLWNGVNFLAYLQLYTLAPVVILFAFMLPILVAFGMKLPSVSPLRWRRTCDKAWTNSVFLVFCIYPAVSLASMLALQCDPQIGRLKTNYKEICPGWGSFEIGYSFVFIFLYALGIPLALNIAMRKLGIVGIVKEKLDLAKFRAMLSLFLQEATSVESQRVARLVSTISDKEEFERQIQHAFDHLCKLSSALNAPPNDCQPGSYAGRENVIDVAKLQALAEDAVNEAMANEDAYRHVQVTFGSHLSDLCTFFLLFDENGDGLIDRDEFCQMILAAHDACNLFTGNEDPGKLTERQIEALLLYDWPEKHAGPSDVDDYQGLGGLLEQVRLIVTDIHIHWTWYIHHDML